MSKFKQYGPEWERKTLVTKGKLLEIVKVLQEKKMTDGAAHLELVDILFNYKPSWGQALKDTKMHGLILYKYVMNLWLMLETHAKIGDKVRQTGGSTRPNYKFPVAVSYVDLEKIAMMPPVE